jgi:hypothetical protein
MLRQALAPVRARLLSSSASAEGAAGASAAPKRKSGGVLNLAPISMDALARRWHRVPPPPAGGSSGGASSSASAGSAKARVGSGGAHTARSGDPSLSSGPSRAPLHNPSISAGHNRAVARAAALAQPGGGNGLLGTQPLSSAAALSLPEIERRMTSIVKGVLDGSVPAHKLEGVTGILWEKYSSGPYPSIAAILEARLIALVEQGMMATAVEHYLGHPDVGWGRHALQCAARAARQTGSVDLHGEVLVRLGGIDAPALIQLLETCITARDTGRVFALLPRIAASGEALPLPLYRRLAEASLDDQTAAQLTTGGHTAIARGVASIASSRSAGDLPDRASLALRELVRARKVRYGRAGGAGDTGREGGKGSSLSPGEAQSEERYLAYDRSLAMRVVGACLTAGDGEAATLAYYAARALGADGLFNQEEQWLRLRAASSLGAPALAEAIVVDMLSGGPPVPGADSLLHRAKGLSSALNMLVGAHARAGDTVAASRVVALLCELRRRWLADLAQSPSGATILEAAGVTTTEVEAALELEGSRPCHRGDGTSLEMQHANLAPAREALEFLGAVVDATSLTPDGPRIGVSPETAALVVQSAQIAVERMRLWEKDLRRGEEQAEADSLALDDEGVQHVEAEGGVEGFVEGEGEGSAARAAILSRAEVLLSQNSEGGTGRRGHQPPLLASYGLAATLLGLPPEAALAGGQAAARGTSAPASSGPPSWPADTEELRSGRMEGLSALAAGYTTHSYLARLIGLGAAEGWAILRGTLPWPPGGPRTEEKGVGEGSAGGTRPPPPSYEEAEAAAAYLFQSGPIAGDGPFGMGRESAWARTLTAAVNAAQSRVFAARRGEQAEGGEEAVVPARVDVSSLTLSAQLAPVTGGVTCPLPDGNMSIYDTLKGTLGLPVAPQQPVDSYRSLYGAGFTRELLDARPKMSATHLTLLLRVMASCQHRALAQPILTFHTRILGTAADADAYAAVLSAHVRWRASSLDATVGSRVVRALRDAKLSPNGAVYGELAFLLGRLGRDDKALGPLREGLRRTEEVEAAVGRARALRKVASSTPVSAVLPATARDEAAGLSADAGADGEMDGPPVPTGEGEEEVQEADPTRDFRSVTGLAPTPLPSLPHFERLLRMLVFRLPGREGSGGGGVKSEEKSCWWNDRTMPAESTGYSSTAKKPLYRLGLELMGEAG